MIARKQAFTALAALACGLVFAASSAQTQTPKTLKIGMVNTLFRDVSESKVQTLLPELQSLMREHTGLNGEFIIVGDTYDLVAKLKSNAVQFGVFHGFEYAWARHSDPDLKPVLIAINRHRSLKAFVAVLKDKNFNVLGDLKGKTISMPKGVAEHCRLFLERELAADGSEPKAYFAKIVNHESVEEALDDVLRDKVQAALIDGEGLDNYEQVNPGRYARLGMLKQIDGFPPGLVAYRQGSIDDATVNKFKEGMLKANSTVTGKEQMAMWRLRAFENIPGDYEQMLTSIVKQFPPPKGK